MSKQIPCWKPAWTATDAFPGTTEILQVPGSKIVAVPLTGQRNSRAFDIARIDRQGRPVMYLTQLYKREVRLWLSRRARADWDCGEGDGPPPTEYMQGVDYPISSLLG